jgi:D-amino-acid oxidase
MTIKNTQQPTLGLSQVKSSFSRRQLLKFTGASAAAAWLSGCTSVPNDALEMPVFSGVRPLSKQPFARPLMTLENIIDIKVGLRPFRASGFVVRGEQVGEKLIIHNYGHGGSGITFSWGSSTLAVRELPETGDRQAAVIGCGVMGLTTARLLQERGWKVTIYAKAFSPNNTSDAAGGQWAPTGISYRFRETHAFSTQCDEALQISYDMFSKQIGAEYGVKLIENYHLKQTPIRVDDYTHLERWPKLFPQTEVLQPNQHPFPTRFALRYLSMVIEPAIFLPKLMQEFRDAGGQVLQREVRDVAELQTFTETVIFNCTGIGAKALFGDEQLTPIRGQILRLRPDERIDFCTHGDGQGVMYMFPRSQDIAVGGSFDRGEAGLAPDNETTTRIVREHARMIAAMRI